MGLKELKKEGNSIKLNQSMIEDHIVQGLLLENKLQIEDLRRVNNSKEIVKGKYIELINELRPETAENVFKRLLDFLSLL